MKIHRPVAGRRAAFTLVELLVVVALIAILVALLVPGATAALHIADTLHCQNNLKHIANAVMAYAALHQGLLPPEGYSGGPPEIDGLRFPAILVYTGSISAPNTAALKKGGEMSQDNHANPFYCPAGLDIHGGSPASPVADPAQGCYREGNDLLMVDSWYYTNADSDDNDVPFMRNRSTNKNYKPHHISEIKDKSTMVVACDGWFANGIRHGTNRIAGRHWGDRGPRSTTNLGFFDGHVENIDRVELEKGFTGSLKRNRPPYFRLSSQ